MGPTASCFLMLQKRISSKQNFEIIKFPFHLSSISKDFTAIDMKKKKKRKKKKTNKTVLSEYIYKFSVDYNIIDTSNIISIHNYLMKKHDIK